MGDTSENSEARLIDANTDRLAGSQENIADIARGDMLRQLGLAMASGFQPDMETSRGGTLFLIGAGCSRSAGVPLGSEVAGIACAMMAQKIDKTKKFCLDDDLSANERRFEDALNFLKDRGYLDRSTNLATDYSLIFQKLFSEQSQQNVVISKALAFGRGQINWAHVCLGQLVHERYVHTVLTTNFDTLILDGIVRCGTIPAVSDSLDTINRIRGKSPHPQLVHLHGSRHAYSQYNKTDDLKHTANRFNLKHMIAELLRDSTALVVVGYAGGEEAVMDHVLEAVELYSDKPIFWVTKSTNLATQSERTQRLMKDGDSARRPRYFMGGWDADDFFRNLMQELGVGLPHWMRDPVEFWTERSKEIVKPNMTGGAEDKTIAGLIDSFTKRLQQLQDCQSRCANADSPQVAERIRQYIASGNIDGVISEIKSADRMDLYRDTLAEALSLIVERAKSSGSHDLMKSALWCVNKIHECVEASGVEWLGAEGALSEIYRAFEYFYFDGYPRKIRTLALETAEQGLKVRLNVAEKQPSQFASAVADGWHQLSNRLVEVGNAENALDAIRKAVEIRESLAKENPGRFNPDLASSLNNLSVHRAASGDQQGALAAITRAVEIYESLAAENPGRFNPDLANSLANLALRTDENGDRGEAIRLMEEAITLITPQADAYPDSHVGRRRTWMQQLLGHWRAPPPPSPPTPP